MPGAAWAAEGIPVRRAPCSVSCLNRPRPPRRHPLCRATSSSGAPADAGDPHGKVLEYGEALARSQEQSFLAAQDELRQQNEQREQARAEREASEQHDAANVIASASATAADATAFVAGASLTAAAGGAAAADAASSATAQPAAGGEPPDAASAASSFADAVRQKLARAAQYRKEKQEAQESAEERGDDSGSEDSGGGGSRRARSGSEGVAAGFLANVMSNPTSGGFSKSQSAEAYTRQKEAERRKNVEIITVEGGYLQDLEEAPARDAEGLPIYRPKVATWGVFERPNDISKAFGGGRTLKPGEALEPEEARTARMQRVSQALKKYRKDAGFEIDPEVEAEAQAVLDVGMTAFRQGQLTAALVHFTDAAARMPLRSRVGGLARMQQAITLDSLGRNQEAKAMYTSLRGHPSANIAKQVRQLLGGFKAADFLKADSFSYRIERGAYDRWFTSVPSIYNIQYSVQDGDDADLRTPTIIALTVVLAPLAVLGVKIASTALSR